MGADRPEARWHVYLVECADGTLYCGATTDVTARLTAHNKGRGARYTRGRGPVQLVWSQAQPSHGDALRREMAVKKMNRGGKMAMARRSALMADSHETP